MRHEKLSEALNEISDRHIAEAADTKRRTPRSPWIGALARTLHPTGKCHHFINVGDSQFATSFCTIHILIKFLRYFKIYKLCEDREKKRNYKLTKKI